jgi:hypothetical protein
MTGSVLRLPGIERLDRAIKFATLNVVPNPECPRLAHKFADTLQ